MDTKPTRRRTVAILVGAAVITAGTVTAGAATSTGDDDRSERPIPAQDLEQAEQAALEETGGGSVTATEVDDEESKYEVEVTLDDGSQVDVQLDEDFQVVGTEREGTADEGAGPDD